MFGICLPIDEAICLEAVATGMITQDVFWNIFIYLKIMHGCQAVCFPINVNNL